MEEKPNCYTCRYCERMTIAASPFLFCHNSPFVYGLGQENMQICGKYEHAVGKTIRDEIIEDIEYTKKNLKENGFIDEEINKMILDVAKLD